MGTSKTVVRWSKLFSYSGQESPFSAWKEGLIMSAGHLERRAVETFGFVAVGQPCENYSDVRMCRHVSRSRLIPRPTIPTDSKSETFRMNRL
jgi:hypothetical protein